MMYKAKAAVCSEIPYKTLNPKGSPCRIFELYAWWYVKKPLGFKTLSRDEYHPHCKGLYLI